MHTKNINERKTWSLQQEISGLLNLNKEKNTALSYGLFFRHYDDQNWDASRYNTWLNSTRAEAIRHNASDYNSRSTSLVPSASIVFNNLLKNVSLNITENFQYINIKTHDYLYHPDTLMLASELDMLNAITDPANSYDSHLKNYRNTISIILAKKASYHYNNNNILSIDYSKWQLGVDIPVVHQSLDYQRGVIDTLVRQTAVFVSPSLQYRHVWPGGNQRVLFRVGHSRDVADLNNKIGYRDDSQPLVVMLGNPDLKGRVVSDMRAEYSNKFGTHQQMLNTSATAYFLHRSTAQSVNYNEATNVYTYMPKNVGGAYNLNANVSFSSAIDNKRRWTWQTNFDAGYDHSVDYTMFSGDTTSHRNVVNTTTLHDGMFIQFNKGTLNLRAVGDVSWRHSTGRMRDFNTFNAWDCQLHHSRAANLRGCERHDV